MTEHKQAPDDLERQLQQQVRTQQTVEMTAVHTNFLNAAGKDGSKAAAAPGAPAASIPSRSTRSSSNEMDKALINNLKLPPLQTPLQLADVINAGTFNDPVSPDSSNHGPAPPVVIASTGAPILGVPPIKVKPKKRARDHFAYKKSKGISFRYTLIALNLIPLIVCCVVVCKSDALTHSLSRLCAPLLSVCSLAVLRLYLHHAPFHVLAAALCVCTQGMLAIAPLTT